MIPINKPKFITFEGGEGSGKSTQSKKLYEYLLAKNIKVIHTREVGGTPEAEKIRDILVHNRLYQTSELMLVMAARYEHINKVIAPALAANKWVICDRFIDSSACYQSEESGLSIEDIFELHTKLMKPSGWSTNIMPAITFFLNLSPHLGLKRSFNTLDTNKFEEISDVGFHQKVYEKFQRLCTQYPDRIKSIDCMGRDEKEIHEEIVKYIISS